MTTGSEIAAAFGRAAAGLNSTIRHGTMQLRRGVPPCPAIPGFRVHRRLGFGNTGGAWLGESPAWGVCVVKVLHPWLAGSEFSRREFRFEAENHAAMSDHPAVVKLIHHEHGARPYLVSEFIKGPTLWELTRHYGRIPEGHAVGLMLPILGALDVAHSRGIDHRGIHTNNVIMDVSRTDHRAPGAKLLDWGWSGLASSDHETASRGDVQSAAWSIYTMIAGAGRPADLKKTPDTFPSVSRTFSALILAAMRFDSKLTARELKAELEEWLPFLPCPETLTAPARPVPSVWGLQKALQENRERVERETSDELQGVADEAGATVGMFLDVLAKDPEGMETLRPTFAKLDKELAGIQEFLEDWTARNKPRC